MFEGFLAPSHVLIVAVIALLLFGDRLPEVMRSVGRGVMEFKKGMRGIESAIEAAAAAGQSATGTSATGPSTTGPAAANQSSIARKDAVGREAISAPRFDPPTAEPRAIEGPARADTSASEPAPPV
jgi:sec-independent protein translocase protein TatA